MQVKKLNRFSGFTLVELAIVLVIIGLLVGGVLTGKELIEVAKVHKVVSEINDLNKGANAFRLKYAFLPGDGRTTDYTRFGLTSWAGGSGSNVFGRDGLIAHYAQLSTDWNAQYERYNFAYNMYQTGITKLERATGLNPSSRDNIFLKSSVFEDTIITPMSFNLFNRPGNQIVYMGHSLWHEALWVAKYPNYWNSNISANFTRSLDLKIDDGMPMTGKMMLVGYSTGYLNSPCEAINPAFLGTCLGHHLDNYNNACATGNSQSDQYVDSDQIGNKGCKFAVKAEF